MQIASARSIISGISIPGLVVRLYTCNAEKCIGTTIAYCEQRCHQEFARTREWVNFAIQVISLCEYDATYPLVRVSIGERRRLGQQLARQAVDSLRAHLERSEWLDRQELITKLTGLRLYACGNLEVSIDEIEMLSWSSSCVMCGVKV